MRDLTDKPFGVNIAQAFVRDPSIVEFVADQGVKFVTTSAGSPTKYTDAAQGGRPHGLPRGAQPGRRAEGGRRRRRRPHRRGRRGRRLQEPAARVDDGAAPARGVEGRRAGDRGRRLRRRPDDGRRARARRRGRAARHADGVVGREPDPRQLEAGRARRRRRPTPCSSTSTPARPCGRCAPSAPTRSSSTPRRTPWCCSATPWTSTSAATWRRPSRCRGQVAGRIDEIKPVAADHRGVRRRTA